VLGIIIVRMVCSTANWWLDDARKVWIGNIPKHFDEPTILAELAMFNIRPIRMKLRDGLKAVLLLMCSSTCFDF
jgi:hypothetical protein